MGDGTHIPAEVLPRQATLEFTSVNGDRYAFTPYEDAAGDDVANQIRRLQSVRGPTRKSKPRRAGRARKLACLLPYSAPKTADRRVRLFYLSRGGELLSCDSTLLSRAAAESLVDKYMTWMPFAQMLYVPTGEVMITYYHAKYTLVAGARAWVGSLNERGSLVAKGIHDIHKNARTEGHRPHPDVLAAIDKVRHVILPARGGQESEAAFTESDQRATAVREEQRALQREALQATEVLAQCRGRTQAESLLALSALSLRQPVYAEALRALGVIYDMAESRMSWPWRRGRAKDALISVRFTVIYDQTLTTVEEMYRQ